MRNIFSTFNILIKNLCSRNTSRTIRTRLTRITSRTCSTLCSLWTANTNRITPISIKSVIWINNSSSHPKIFSYINSRRNSSPSRWSTNVSRNSRSTITITILSISKFCITTILCNTISTIKRKNFSPLSYSSSSSINLSNTLPPITCIIRNSNPARRILRSTSRSSRFTIRFTITINTIIRKNRTYSIFTRSTIITRVSLRTRLTFWTRFSLRTNITFRTFRYFESKINRTTRNTCSSFSFLARFNCFNISNFSR